MAGRENDRVSVSSSQLFLQTCFSSSQLFRRLVSLRVNSFADLFVFESTLLQTCFSSSQLFCRLVSLRDNSFADLFLFESTLLQTCLCLTSLVCVFPAVWNLRAFSLIPLFYISLVLLPSPIAFSVTLFLLLTHSSSLYFPKSYLFER